jgi:hypothetical protein
MNTRKMILSGAILATLIALVSLSSYQIALAGEIGTGATPTGHMQISLIKKVLDICDPNEGGVLSGSDALPGGSIPPSGQQFGCVKVFGDRMNQYLFTGEQLGVLVAIRDTEGSLAISKPVELDIDGATKVMCNDITDRSVALLKGNGDPNCELSENCWYGHDVSQDLIDQPAAKGAAINGFNSNYDKLYECIYTVAGKSDPTDTEPVDSGLLLVDVMTNELNGAEVRGALDQVWFNPTILVDVSTMDESGTSSGPSAFEDGSAGQTVYSTNHLVVTNEADGGVILYVWLAGTDLVSTDGLAKCPYSNIIDVEGAVGQPNAGMEYRCKIGSFFNNDWTFLSNPDDTDHCGVWHWNECDGAKPLLPDHQVESFLTAGSWAECWFRLTYPVPCIGTFDQGTILVFARAI